jgi:hypothetical protein
VAIVPSAADRGLLYVATATEKPGVGLATVQLLRSRDGGASWEPIAAPPSMEGDVVSLGLVAAHPTDAQRVYVSWGYYVKNAETGNISRVAPLEVSSDQGTTWQ